MNDILYRNEKCYGDGSKLITEVMQHEIFELANSDILYYIRNEYAKALSEKQYKELNKIITVIETFGNYEDEDSQKRFCEDMLDSINRYLNKNLKYCLWLADMDAVLEYYDGQDTPWYIRAYETSDYILSDIDDEGKLFMYETEPVSLQEQKNGKVTTNTIANATLRNKNAAGIITLLQAAKDKNIKIKTPNAHEPKYDTRDIYEINPDDMFANVIKDVNINDNELILTIV